METRLWHDLPAILDGDMWTVISADFTNIAKIPKDEIDSIQIFSELVAIDFFKPEVSTKDVFQLTLITTSDCNLRCRYCFANSGDSALVMSYELAKASIDYGFKKSADKILSIAFFGGEPSLTGKLIRDTVKYAKENLPATSRGVEFSITTNGVISKNFVKFLINNNFQITLSADGPDYIQDYQRPTKTGEKSSPHVEKTIKTLVKAGAKFKLRATVTDYSVNKMTDTVTWFKNLGGTEIHFEPVTISGRALKAGELTLQQPSAEVFSSELKRAILLGCQVGVGIMNSSFMNISSPPPEFCEGNANKRLAVSYTGDVTTCVEVQDKCHQASKNFIIGHYDEQEKMLVIERETRNSPCSGYVAPKCQDCFALRICGGGCPVRNFHATGSLETIDGYRCQQITTMLPFIIKLCDLES